MAARQVLQSIPLAVGLLFAPVSANDTLCQGVSITTVKDGQAASLSGLRPGDIIYSIHGRPTHSKSGFLLALKGLLAGDTVPIDVKRAEQRTIMTITIGGRDKTQQEIKQIRAEAGME